VPVRFLFSFLSLTSLAFAGTFDKPLSIKTVHLRASKSSPGVRSKVKCYYFSSFMVKEVDLGEKGASRLAVLPAGTGHAPPCSRLRGKTEKVVNADDWSGYFKGVKGSLVFFDADDGVNGGLGFAIYDAKTMKKIFDDVALGNLQFSDASGSQLTMTYTRIVEGECNVPKEQAACWDKIKKKLSLENASAPDCKTGYENSAQTLAKGRCQAQNTDNAQCLAKEITLARQQTNDANSVIVYPVEVVVSEHPALKPAAGNVRCWPAD
jgi:hypothetical protein